MQKKIVADDAENMQEEKFKKVVIGSTVAAVILLAFLLVFLIGQLISISSRKSREAELLRQIEEYERYIETAQSDCEVYQGRIWLEIAVRELLALRGEDAGSDTASVLVSFPADWSAIE